MIVQCPSCKVRFSVATKLVKENPTANFQCSHCSHIFPIASGAEATEEETSTSKSTESDNSAKKEDEKDWQIDPNFFDDFSTAPKESDEPVSDQASELSATDNAGSDFDSDFDNLDSFDEPEPAPEPDPLADSILADFESAISEYEGEVDPGSIEAQSASLMGASSDTKSDNPQTELFEDDLFEPFDQEEFVELEAEKSKALQATEYLMAAEKEKADRNFSQSHEIEFEAAPNNSADLTSATVPDKAPSDIQESIETEFEPTAENENEAAKGWDDASIPSESSTKGEEPTMLGANTTAGTGYSVGSGGQAGFVENRNQPVVTSSVDPEIWDDPPVKVIKSDEPTESIPDQEPSFEQQSPRAQSPETDDWSSEPEPKWESPSERAERIEPTEPKWKFRPTSGRPNIKRTSEDRRVIGQQRNDFWDREPVNPPERGADNVFFGRQIKHPERAGQRNEGQSSMNWSPFIRSLGLLAPALLTCLAIFFISKNLDALPGSLTEFFSLKPRNLQQVASPGLKTQGAKAELITLDNGRQVLEISGTLVSEIREPLKDVNLEALVFDKNGNVIANRIVSIRNPLHRSISINAFSETKLEEMQRDSSGDIDRDSYQSQLVSGRYPFRIIFSKPPKEMAYFSTRVLSQVPIY